MAAKLEEITGIFLGEKNRWDMTIIGQVDVAAVNGEARNGKANSSNSKPSLNALVRNIIAIKGSADEFELEEGMTYRFYGRYTEHPKWGRQFHFQTFTIAAPHGKRGVISYLQHAPGVGKVIADALWATFGTDAVAKLRETPHECAAAIPRLSTEAAAGAAKFLAEHQALENCSIDLVELFAARGFPKRLVKEATKAWGNEAAEFIRRNPYLLMRFRGVGFLRCDALYLDLGLPPARLERQAYAAWYALASDTEGHTWHPVNAGVKGINQRIAGAATDPPAALKLAKRDGVIATHRDEAGALWLADGKKGRQEEACAEYIAAAMEETPLACWPEAPTGTELSEHQLENLGLATSGGLIGILAGSPGTGKSFTAAVLIRELIREHGEHAVAVAAPTGKAAVRVTEAMERYAIPLRATTIHRLLGVESNDGGGWSFRHNESCPLPLKFIVVDESSMIDAGLMASLLAARGSGTHVLFIGDPYQLPPVGHGAPLRDMIAAGLPCGELKEIRRNAGAIVRACAEIRDKSTFAGCRALDLDAGENLLVVEANSPESQIARLESLYESVSKQGRRNPIWDVQVLVPVNARSPLARKKLNAHLQGLLNPAGEQAAGNPFRVGDKIICTKNGWLPSDDPEHPEANPDGKVAVANGEMGEVLEVAPKLTIAKMSSPDRVVKIPRGAADSGEEKQSDSGADNGNNETTDTGCNWDLAYAISVHKSQGSEFPLAVVMIDEYRGARMVCSREWWYTAISRAKEACILIGKETTAVAQCRRTAIKLRKTFLAERVAAAATATTELASV